jgi:peroxiredoxin
MPKVELNNLAPDFSLPDFNGNPINISDYKDQKHVLLVFNRGFL